MKKDKAHGASVNGSYPSRQLKGVKVLTPSQRNSVTRELMNLFLQRQNMRSGKIV